ncbi:hypothetical protein AA313_de0202530 [Arthrobotrys entomopaga]|nr:hypothetical protein AA313_de0202530 [Arthrobotrys entomopaga]
MNFLWLGAFIALGTWKSYDVAAVAVPRATELPSSKNPHPGPSKLTNWRFWQPAGTNQYAHTPDQTIFEDHWGDHTDIGHYDYLSGLADDASNNHGLCHGPNASCTEWVSGVDPDPKFAGAPRDKIHAIPIFCQDKMIVFVQYDPSLAKPPGPPGSRPVFCDRQMYQIRQLIAAIRNKWVTYYYRKEHPNSKGDVPNIDPEWKWVSAFPAIAPKDAPKSYEGSVYKDRVTFQILNYDAIQVQIVGRTRWSQDQSEWAILGLINPDDPSAGCPFRLPLVNDTLAINNIH